MAGHDIAAWSNFGVGVIGAAAALTGLLFVAVSINLERILAYPALPRRAGQTLVLFATPMLVATMLLVPEQSTTALGAELIVVGLLAGAILAALSGSRTDQETTGSFVVGRALPSGIVSVAVMVAGVMLITGGPGGLLWLVPAVVAALLAGLANAWVLLVEIQR